MIQSRSSHRPSTPLLSLAMQTLTKSSLLLVVVPLLLTLSSFTLPSVTATTTTAADLEYLKTNAAKPDVVTLESGLQYRVLERGSGVYHPKPSTPCLMHYRGTLTDGTQFDSSYDRGTPTGFAPNQVIRAWTEAMQLMVEGDKWELTIPSDLGYGDRGSPPKIPGGAVLVFVMEMVEIQGDDEGKVLAIKCDVVTKENCNEREVKYIHKWTAVSESTTDKTPVKELERLSGMVAGKMKPDLKEWLQRRVNILDQLVEGSKDNGEEGEL